MVYQLPALLSFASRKFISVMDDINVQESVTILLDAIIEGKGPSFFEVREDLSNETISLSGHNQDYENQEKGEKPKCASCQ